jgi:4-amino-4-deoxy-L-arabinose transferase-like glycosyltransferase
MSARRTELVVVSALALVAVAFWALVPTYPNYDAYYHLVWGREIVDGHLPTFEAYQAPTQHPLYLVICAVLGLFGEHADRLLVLLTCLCHVAFTYAVYRLGTAMWDRKAGVMAALLAGSSFALLLYAARAYVDEPFLALVLWAAALEAERSAARTRVVFAPTVGVDATRTAGPGDDSAAQADRGGRAVWILLILAGLLRPEAWVLGGGYWLWLSWRARRPLWAAIALPLVAPLIWCAVDAIVTGDPLFSLHSTSDLADELNRTRSLSEVPGDFVSFLVDTARPPVALAALAGVAWAWHRREARAVHVALALFIAGTFTFFATSVAGLSVLPRYLTVPAVALCLPAGYLVTRSRALLAVAVVAGLAFTVVRADAFDRLATELRFIRSTHDDLTTVLHTREVAQGRRCGAVTLPNYRLVPDTRWILDASQKQVGSRSAIDREYGVALLLVGEKLLRRYGFADGASPRTNAPPDGFLRGPIRGGFTAYLSCPEGG